MAIGEPLDTGHICDWIDAILEAEKSFGGRPGEWKPGNRAGEKRLTWPVEVEGELIGLAVGLTAYPSEPSLRFTITLNVQVPGWPKPSCIWRVDYEPSYKYHPPRLGELLIEGFGEDPEIRGPHFHSWDRNRYLCKPHALPATLERAEPLSSDLRFDQILRWFCGKTNITLAKPYMVELPRPDTLI